VADENLDIIIEARAEGQHSVNAMKDAFDDLRRSVEETSLATVASVPAMEAATAIQSTMGAATQATTQEIGGLAGKIGEMASGVGLALPVIAGLAAEITFALLPALTFLVGELGALATGLLPLLALGGLAAVFTELELQTGRWASSTKELDAANKNLTTTTTAHEQALRSLKEAQDALIPGRQLTQVQLDHIQDLQKKVAETSNAVTVATNAQAEALKRADNPWLTLKTHLESVANEIADRAEPALRSLFFWLDHLVPAGQTFADRATDWFDKQLPAALREMEDVFAQIGPIVEGIIGDIGHAFDNQLGHPASFKDAVAVAFSQVRGAIDTLLGWLGRLSAWWESDGKRFASDAAIDFQALQIAIEVTAGVVGVLAEEFHIFASVVGPVASTVGTIANAFWGAWSAINAAADALARFIALKSGGGGGGGVDTNLSFAEGGTVPGPIGMPRLAMVHGGETIIPVGASGGGSADTHLHINVNAAAASPADVGRAIVKAIQEYERRTGKGWRT
jgi:hypothetical protein